MSRDGYWINYRSGKEAPVDEHERHIREEGNAAALGVPLSVIKNFDKFEPIRDRVKFLTYIMEHSPLMRVRGHGNSVSFEYASRSRDPIEAIWEWGKQNAGAFTLIDVHNLKTHENASLLWQDFKDVVDRDGYDGIMRVATHSDDVASLMRRVASEILETIGEDGV